MAEVRSTAIRGALGADVIFDLDLDVFAGPFDLLITLILRDEIDLGEVSVMAIIAAYVEHLSDTGDYDLEATSQFVVLVAALLELKVRLLLAEPVVDELEELDAEQAAEQLIARLSRYGQFKNAAADLERRFRLHADRLYRTAPVPETLRKRPLAESLPAAALADALTPLLREPPRPDMSHVADLAVSVLEELGRLRTLLAHEQRFTFAAVAPSGRIERAVTFFALLELNALGEVKLSQSQPFADISVTALAADGGNGDG